MDILFFLVAFAGVFLAMFLSLGTGFLAVIAVGYLNGVIRANFLGMITIRYVSPTAAVGPLQR